MLGILGGSGQNRASSQGTRAASSLPPTIHGPTTSANTVACSLARQGSLDGRYPLPLPPAPAWPGQAPRPWAPGILAHPLSANDPGE